MNMKTKAFLVIIALLVIVPTRSWALASTNIPLDSPVYFYLEKLSGFGLLDSDVKGLKPYSKAEAARLLLEAEGNLTRLGAEVPAFATELMLRLHEQLQREVSLQNEPDKAPLVDYNILSAARLRYVYLDGIPRDYNRDVHDPAHQSAFGFIGGDLRPLGAGGIVHTTGTEGTPLLENNEGVIYRHGHNAELRWSMEGYGSDMVAVLLEPLLLHTPINDVLRLQKGYLKVGSGGLELEIGRDANWFGPGYRGTTILTNNARNFDLVKLSSPEPLNVGWVKKYIGDLKYALIVSRFDETGSGVTLRQPWFVGLKLAVKPRPWYEIGFNVVREQGGPGFAGSPSLKESIFGGGDNDHLNSIAGVDLRFRIHWLRNTELYGEFSGEDNAGGVWPIVESYVAGIYVPRLTASGRDDLRFEYFWGSVMLYGDWQFPAGYVYHNMTPGHSQGTAAQDFFVRYSHWFSVRNNLALEYFHTDRGKYGKVAGQAVEYKNAGRVFWNFPLHEKFDCGLMYGLEGINNFNLVAGVKRTNQLLKVDLSYRY
jgi:hypothetical protein